MENTFFWPGVIMTIIILTTLHELGHVACAKWLRLQVDKIGFSMYPYPHPYVSISNVPDNLSKYLFLAAGTAFTILALLCSWLGGLLATPLIYWGFCLQIIIETNPFYSDITIAVNLGGSDEDRTAYLEEHMAEYVDKYGLDNMLSYHSQTINAEIHQYFNRYSYTALWYLHFFAWATMATLLLSPN
jgi:hypothetical protein